MLKQEVGLLGAAFSLVNGVFVLSNDGTGANIKPIVRVVCGRAIRPRGAHLLGDQPTNVETREGWN
jgi:hypothetical protein